MRSSGPAGPLGCPPAAASYNPDRPVGRPAGRGGVAGNVPRLNALNDATPPLAVDLHYLMTVWAGTAAAEHSILGWAMRQFHLHPLLDASVLPEAGWDPGDVIQVIPAELTNEGVMRIWDALDPPYRLSVAYVVRVIRIDPDGAEVFRPVVPPGSRRGASKSPGSAGGRVP